MTAWPSTASKRKHEPASPHRERCLYHRPGQLPMHCEVINDQVEIRFGNGETGLHLYFEWPGFLDFMRLVHETAAQALATPRGTTMQFIVNADSDQ